MKKKRYFSHFIFKIIDKSRFLKVKWIARESLKFVFPFYLKFKLPAVSQMSYIRSEISISSASWNQSNFHLFPFSCNMPYLSEYRRAFGINKRGKVNIWQWQMKIFFLPKTMLKIYNNNKYNMLIKFNSRVAARLKGQTCIFDEFYPCIFPV